MSESHVSSTAPSWRRVSALSASLTLHVLAAALALMAVLKPIGLIMPAPEPVPLTVIDVLDPPPIPDEPVKAVAPKPSVDPAPPRPTRPTVRERVAPTVQPISPTLRIDTSVAIDATPQPADTNDTSMPANDESAVEYASVSLPHYPAVAKQKGLQGETLLRVRVSAGGAVEAVEIVRSSGHQMLDRAAMSSVRRWRFKPAMESGVAIPRWVEVPVSFRLDNR